MKKAGFAFIAMLVLATNCDRKKSMLNDFSAVFDNAAKEMKAVGPELAGAKDAKTAVAALNRFHDTLMGLKTKTEAMEKEYGLSSNGAWPPEIKAKSEEFGKVVQEIVTGPFAAVITKYRTDPEASAIIEKIIGKKR